MKLARIFNSLLKGFTVFITFPSVLISKTVKTKRDTWRLESNKVALSPESIKAMKEVFTNQKQRAKTSSNSREYLSTNSSTKNNNDTGSSFYHYE